MKNLKKLSVVIFATLLSFNFTSCLDTDVSPVVEGIYQAQADLLNAEAQLALAEATLAEAEAALAMAEAMAEQLYAETDAMVQAANIADTEARTAAFLAEEEAQLARYVAQTALDAAYDEARNAIYLADQQARLDDYIADQAQALARAISELERAEATAANSLYEQQERFKNTMEQLARNLRSYANSDAYQYGSNYATAMGAIEALKEAKLLLVFEISEEELFMKNLTAGSEMTWAVYLAGLESDIMAEEATIASKEAFIERATEYVGSVPAMEDALEAAEDALEANEDAIDALVAERGEWNVASPTEGTGILGDINANYQAFLDEYDDMETALNSDTLDKEALEDELAVLDTITIPGLEAAILDYDAMTATLEAAVAAAEAVIGSPADGTNHATNHPEGSGLLEAIRVAYDSVWVPADAAYQKEVTALGKAVDAAIEDVDLATTTLASFTLDYNALFTSYQTAATNLAAAQAATNTVQLTADVANAESELVTATIAFDLVQMAYDDAKAVFEADPSGTEDVDGDHMNLDYDILGDFTEAVTYRRVKTWKSNDPFAIGGSFIPETYYAEEYNQAEMDAYDDVLVAATNTTGAISTTSPTNEGIGTYQIAALSDIYFWTAQATNTLSLADMLLSIGYVTSNVDDADISTAYFVEVSSDDSQTVNVTEFNLAVAALGEVIEKGFWVDVVSGTTVIGMVPDVAFTGTLTANQVLWNAGLKVVQLQYLLDNGVEALADVQAIYDEQKALFDLSDVTFAALTQAVADAKADLATAKAATADDTDVKAALAAWNALKDELGVDYGTPTATDLPITFDVHANDGLDGSASEPYIYTIAASAGYDSDDEDDEDGNAEDTLTAYAELWNAELALAIHDVMDLDDYEAALEQAMADVVDKTNKVAEFVILITRGQADLDALTDEYDALMATPFYAAMQVRLLEIADELTVLKAEWYVLNDEVDALQIELMFEDVVINTSSSTTAQVGAIQAEINACQTYVDATGPALLAKYAAQIAKGEVSVADMQANIEFWMDQIADIDAEIETKAAEAASYKALLLAVLATLG